MIQWMGWDGFLVVLVVFGHTVEKTLLKVLNVQKRGRISTQGVVAHSNDSNNFRMNWSGPVGPSSETYVAYLFPSSALRGEPLLLHTRDERFSNRSPPWMRF